MTEHDQLATELQTYERHRQDLLRTSEDKFVLIHGEKVSDVFDTDGDAVQQGYERFGNVPFLVKKIERHERPENFVSYLIAL